MIDLIASAKCGLIDRMFVGTFWVPMMPTVVALSAFVFAHCFGRLAAHALAIRPLRIHGMWASTRPILSLLGAIIVFLIALRGLMYPVFLARMVKDSYYCSYIEIGRDLRAAHFIVFGLMFIAHVLCVVVFDDHRFQRLEPSPLKIAATTAYAMLGLLGYLMAIALDATLVPLTILFILPFACCGIGVLARQR
ncbi:hypothetical protein [Rhizobium sp.]